MNEHPKFGISVPGCTVAETVIRPAQRREKWQAGTCHGEPKECAAILIMSAHIHSRLATGGRICQDGGHYCQITEDVEANICLAVEFVLLILSTYRERGLLAPRAFHWNLIQMVNLLVGIQSGDQLSRPAIPNRSASPPHAVEHQARVGKGKSGSRLNGFLC